MKVLAEANANAAISILHALGLGKGCSIGINLKTTVRLVSEPQKVEGDFHNLLQTIEEIWSENGYPLPEKFGWQIFSEIPIGQGLKSSSAISCAAIKALNLATWAGLTDSQIVDIAVSSQIRCGCSVTGSMDDTWASISRGWKLVDPKKSAQESIILEGTIEDEISIFLILRGKRDKKILSNEFNLQSRFFERAHDSLIDGSIFQAISNNGMAVAVATGDDEAIRISNKLISNGAIAAGITGSGPAISVMCFIQDSDRIREILLEMDFEIIETNFIENEVLELTK